jgi:hypothetical protein
VKLSQEWIDVLKSQPKSGADYQICTIEDKNNIHKGVYVFDYEDVADETPVDVDSIKSIKVEDVFAEGNHE